MTSIYDFHAGVIKKIISEAGENPERKFDISYVAKRTGYSKWYIQRVFKKVTGETIGRYLRKARIDYSITLINSGNMSLVDITYECNYNSQQSFSRAFKSIYGVPPFEYRKVICSGTSITLTTAGHHKS
ncbi:helix-turn-helix domain-containing protein [Serratia fonticola]|uniref:helix-turn-helix domain-containing protein n=1 Tax=Serratia fonticola TaxID=47917 RepID=UPI000E0E46E0|nr:AraC family transcriptional regulator [Serratia fonticola]